MNNRFLKVRMAAFAVCLALALLGCEEDGAVSDWQVLFSDGFNRANTAGQDLGSTDWIIYTDGTVPGGTTMFISGNLVESHWANGSFGIYAAYTGTVDYSEQIKISVKIKVNSSGVVPNNVGGLGMNLQLDSASYALQINSDQLWLYEWDGATVVGSSTASYTLANNTWYTLELESSGLELTGRLKDADGTSVLATCTYTELGTRSYTDGAIAFFDYTSVDGINPTDQPVYFEDFSLSAWQ